MNCTDPDSTILENPILGSTPDSDVVYGFSGGNVNGAFAIDPVRYQHTHIMLSSVVLMLRLLESFH